VQKLRSRQSVTQNQVFNFGRKSGYSTSDAFLSVLDLKKRTSLGLIVYWKRPKNEFQFKFYALQRRERRISRLKLVFRQGLAS
jgi:hypothetical protein